MVNGISVVFSINKNLQSSIIVKLTKPYQIPELIMYALFKT